MANTLEHFAFDPPEGLESKEYSPTYPESEEAIRAQLQGIPNQLRDKLNELIGILSDETPDASGADHIGTGELPGLSSRRVGGQLKELFTLMQNITLGAIPDGTITTAKLADESVTTQKLAPGAVTAERLVDEIAGRIAIAARLTTGSYTGTGTEVTETDPKSLVFEFVPKLVIIAMEDGEFTGTANGQYRVAFFYCRTLNETFRPYGYHSFSIAATAKNSYAYAKLVEQTLTWYSTGSTDGYGLNEKDETYHWIAIG